TEANLVADETTVTGTTYSDSGLTNGTTYYYAVVAVDGADQASALSNEASATPTAADVAPAAPTGLTATANDDHVTLAWTPPADTDIAGYKIYRSESSGVATDGTPYAQIAPAETYDDS